MAELKPVHLLNKLTEHSEFHASVFFTYGVDLAFFEEAILHPLWQNRCHNNLVFMDARRYAETISDWRGSVTWVGRRYLLIPIDLGALQSFHPKLVLLLGHERGRLLIGSGNLTFTGFGHNHEVFTCLDWTPDDSRLQHLFTQAWNMVNIVLQRWGHSDEARTMLHKAAHVSDWLTRPAEPTPEVQLFHTLEEPLIDQCSRALSGEASDRITVLSPFLDSAAVALSEIYSRLRPGKLCLVLQDQRTVGNVEALKNLCQAGVPLEMHRFNDDNRYLHAKIYIFDAADASYVLTGSANCTRAAWLTTCADGNFEIALLRRADSQQHFDPLLEARVAPHAIVSFDEISFKQENLPPPDGEEVSVRLLDVSVRHDMLSVSCLINSLPEGVTDLWLRLSTTPPHRIALGRHRLDLHTFQKPVSQELQAALKRPLSASVWGSNAAGEPVDLHCNELWMTNADELRREISRVLPADVRTGGYLAEMALSSEEEWRDLFESLARLLELDVTGLKRRGGTYTASPPIKRPKPQEDAERREVEIRLVTEAEEAAEREDVATALFQESPLYAWLEYVCGRLPGTALEPSKTDDKPRKPDANVISRGKQHRRRWTPPERLGRRFVNLVDKYIRSLANVEYMQTISTLHIPCYYSVFQRIVRLLLQHAVITPESFVQLAAKINRGFFGAPDDNPPVLCPCLRQHLQRAWHDEWRAAEVPFYALASVVLSERPGIGSLKSESENEELAAQMHEIREQNLRALCGIASVMGIEWVRSDIEVLAQQAGEAYGLDGDAFACQLMDYLEHSLSSMNTVLDEWILKASIRLVKIDDPHMEALLRRARVDYALARYDVLAYLQDANAQAQLCSDLIFWLRCAGDPSAAREWGEQLVDLLQSQGKSHKTARAMFRQGRALFFDREYHQAASILRQAFLLAERLGDSSLSAQCEQFLEHTGFFLQ